MDKKFKKRPEAEGFMPSQQPAPKKKYYTSKEAAEWLCRSERTLLNMRNNGLLIEGTCWVRKIPQNPNSHVLYNLDACEEVLLGLHKASTMEDDLITTDIEVASA